ncbi:hypothetical protein BDZ45DRAFT_755209 [Acephala macrosclerotiorum]|nr:hypothetical protein BDZ45DRAFT_755209 [Acephala macrosclerotiorum]
MSSSSSVHQPPYSVTNSHPIPQNCCTRAPSIAKRHPSLTNCQAIWDEGAGSACSQFPGFPIQDDTCQFCLKIVDFNIDSMSKKIHQLSLSHVQESPYVRTSNPECLLLGASWRRPWTTLAHNATELSDPTYRNPLPRKLFPQHPAILLPQTNLTAKKTPGHRISLSKTGQNGGVLEIEVATLPPPKLPSAVFPATVSHRIVAAVTSHRDPRPFLSSFDIDRARKSAGFANPTLRKLLYQRLHVARKPQYEVRYEDNIEGKHPARLAPSYSRLRALENMIIISQLSSERQSIYRRFHSERIPSIWPFGIILSATFVFSNPFPFKESAQNSGVLNSEPLECLSIQTFGRLSSLNTSSYMQTSDTQNAHRMSE